MKECAQHVGLSDWLISLNIMFLKFIYIMEFFSTSFFNIPLFEFTTLCFSNHQLMDIWVAYAF